MAKKKEPNKSQLIRDYKAKNPKATASEIVEALKAHKVAFGLVYAALRTKKKSKGKAKTVKVADSNGHASELVHSAFTIGIDKAIKLLEKVKAAIE